MFGTFPRSLRAVWAAAVVACEKSQVSTSTGVCACVSPTRHTKIVNHAKLRQALLPGVLLLDMCLFGGGSTTSAEDVKLSITLVATPELHAPEYYPTLCDVHIFGRRVLNTAVMIDSETRGLANVFVWVDASGEPEPSVVRPVDHTIYVANGTYAPSAVVAKEGDRLIVRPIDLAIVNPRTEFPVSPESRPANGINMFELRDYVNKPMTVTCSHYPWLAAAVFVEKGTRCVTTDRLGRAELRLADNERPARIFLGHAFLGRVRVLDAPQGVTVVEPGVIEVAPKLLKGKGTIVLTVSEEEEQKQDAGNGDEPDDE